MYNSTRPLPSHLRQTSTSGKSASTGQSPILLARINEKKAELENLKQLRDLSAGLAGQMQMLEEKLLTLSDGTEAVATVLGNWHNVLRAISMASTEGVFGTGSSADAGEDTYRACPDASTGQLASTLYRVADRNLRQEYRQKYNPRHHLLSNMARVTRSRKIAIAEDDISPSVDIKSEHNNLQPGKALAETNIIMAINTVTTTCMEDAMHAAEVKGLKAAYKSALGVGKKIRRGKGKRKDKQADSQDTLVEEEVPVPEQVSASPPPDSSALVNRRDIMPIPAEPQSMVQPAIRTTRSQLAKAQAGQYSYNMSDFFGSRDCSVVSDKLQGIDFITLFGGRPTGSNRARKVSTSSREALYGYSSTNHYLSLAKDDLITSHAEIEGNGLVDKNSEVLTKGEASIHLEGKENHTTGALAGSPVKTLEEIERLHGSEEPDTLADDTGEDSFVQEIICRSPAKRVSRIEDSVEALDQLEEALEALDQATLAESMCLPEKSRQIPRLPTDSSPKSEKPVSPQAEKQKVREQTPRPGYATMRAKPAPKHASSLKKAASMTFKPASYNSKPDDSQTKVQPAKATVKRPVSLMQPKETLKSTKAPTRSTFELPGEAVALKLKEQREARLAQRQSSEDSFHTARTVSGPKIKSTKAPTKPTFQLPGEEVSRRKRAAHDARLKAQEEEERKRREFKARPIRNSVVPSMVPRDTVASRARTSKVGTDDVEDGNLSVSKRGSNVGAHRPSIAHLALANSSAPRAKGTYIPPVRKPSPTPPEPSRPLPRAISVTNSTLRKRAKEIYNRDAVLTAEMEKEKRDREAAAKRAREEAAERGRQASREWAEKQMARRMVEGEKGMGAA
ncbi:carboxylesterase family protein [Diplocarpon rosae]|nr:carboxylesterase family protein [Diplocarpon rosae]